jgi:hypothetical protein
LAGTLVAVAIGAIVASMVATVVSEAVRGQRAVIDRDEMSEFSLHLKQLLTNDSTCLSVLRGVNFPLATGGDVPLALNVGYQDLAGPLQEGFLFAGNKLRIAKLRLKDKGITPFLMKAAVTDSAGVTTVRDVRRVMAQVMLQVDSGDFANSPDPKGGYRPRFFEIPVHLDAAGTQILSCNNEFNIADACAAMGFKYNPNPAPGDSFCQPDKACFSGGSYSSSYNNPATGAQSCPDGFTPFVSGAQNYAALSCGKNCCFLQAGNFIYQCLKCTP